MKQLETCPSVQAAEYVPVAGDFAQLEQADIATDTNYASQGYWKGVATHFVRNKRAMIGLILVLLMIFLAFVAPLFSGYVYDEIVTALNAKGRKKAAVGISPRVPAIHEMVTGEPYDDIYADKTFLFGTDDLGRDLWTRTWYGARVSLMIAFVTIIIDMLIGMSYGLLSGYFVTQVMFSIPTVIFTEAFLSFVGVGIVLPQCSIGTLIEDGFNNITTLPYQIIPPILALALLMLGFNFIGDGLREALAPKLEDM